MEQPVEISSKYYCLSGLNTGSLSHQQIQRKKWSQAGTRSQSESAYWRRRIARQQPTTTVSAVLPWGSSVSGVKQNNKLDFLGFATNLLYDGTGFSQVILKGNENNDEQYMYFSLCNDQNFHVIFPGYCHVSSDQAFCFLSLRSSTLLRKTFGEGEEEEEEAATLSLTTTGAGWASSQDLQVRGTVWGMSSP